MDSGFDWLYDIFGTLCYLFDVQVDVVLRGYSGYNTRWVLKVLDKVFHAVEGGDGFEPLAVTVFFGANDACLPDRCSAFQHVPLEEYKRNLLSVISSLKVNSFSLSFPCTHRRPHRITGTHDPERVAFSVGPRKITVHEWPENGELGM